MAENSSAHHHQGVPGSHLSSGEPSNKENSESPVGLNNNGDMEMAHMTLQQQPQPRSLVTAQPVEQAVQDDTIPAAVHYDPDAPKPYPAPKKYSYRVLGLLAVVLCVMVITVVAVVVTQVSSSSDSSSNGNTLAPTGAPTTFRENLGIQEQITEVFGIEKFQDLDSAHSKAMDWILNKDPMQLEPEADNLIQRFAMAYFYFHTSQRDGPWLSCNPPQGDEKDQCNHLMPILLFSESEPPSDFKSEFAQRWLSAQHECFWAGVLCQQTERVTDITLNAYNLSGEFPADLAKLEYLRTLSLNWNEFTGSLPSSFAEFPSFRSLELVRNHFSGTLPREWFHPQSALHGAFLSYNQITGSIPTEVGLLTNLRYFLLEDNDLTGTMPSELFSLTDLTELDVQSNKLSGSILTEIGMLSNMELLYLGNNDFTGTLASEFGLLDKLFELKIHETLLTGSIPDEFYPAAENLQTLSLESSQLTGTISPRIAQLSNLGRLFLFDNQFNGTLPSEMGLLTKLKYLTIHHNSFSGADVMPEELCALRVDSFLEELKADCLETSSSLEPHITCPAMCCTHCCNGEGGMCLEVTDGGV